jgi:hypothetical protein
MKYHKELLQTQAALAEFKKAREAREEAIERYRKQDEEETSRRMIYLKDWLFAPAVDADHNRFAEVRSQYPESGNWLLQRKEFREWHEPTLPSSPMLWIHGIPGAGKETHNPIPILPSQTDGRD